MKLVYDSKLSLEKELLLLEKLGQITINKPIKVVKSKQRTRGTKYTDIQILFMVFLYGLKYSKSVIATHYNTDRKTIKRCIDRGYKLIDNGGLHNITPKSPIGIRSVKLSYVGGANKLDYISNNTQ